MTSCESDQVLEPAISAGESTTCALRGMGSMGMGDGRIAVDCFMGFHGDLVGFHGIMELYYDFDGIIMGKISLSWSVELFCVGNS